MTSSQGQVDSLKAIARGLAKALGKPAIPGLEPGPSQDWQGEVPTEPCELALALGRCRELSLSSEARIRGGAHHTPPELARALATQALEHKNPKRILDPCCGAGIFLCAVAEQRLARGMEPMEGLEGWDLDPMAVLTTELVLGIAFGQPLGTGAIRQVDALEASWPTVDLVITNPPYVSSALSKGGLDPSRRKALRERFPLGFQGRGDLAAAFVEASVRAVRDGGQIALVLPESLIATAAGEPLRRWLVEEAPPSQIDLLGADAFPDAQVRTCTWLLQRAAPAAEIDLRSRSSAETRVSKASELRDLAWSQVLASPHWVPAHESAGELCPLSELSSMHRGFTDDFYFLARSVYEAEESDPPHPVVTVGLVDPGRHWWAERRAKIQGHWYQRPALRSQTLRAEDERRATRLLERQKGRRLVLATRSAVLEVTEVPEGTIAQVPLITLWAAAGEDLDCIYAQLLSPVATAWYLRNHGHLDQTGAGVDLRVPALQAMPLLPTRAIPAAQRRVLRPLLGALRSRPAREELQAVQKWALAAHGLAESELLQWWWQRLPAKIRKSYSR